MKWLHSPIAFAVVLSLLVLLGLVRSYVATDRDGLTIDEAWHAVAAASYVQTGDFRLNPEHPPLMKLWVGMALPEQVFKLPPFRPLVDKEDERAFINQAFFLDNDPNGAQTRARLAMLSFHGVLLLVLGFVLRQSVGPALALLCIGLLLLDPTVAAHLPAVLTDLPLALTSSLAVLLAVVAFRSWRPRDLLLASLALGLAFGAKHSGLVTVAAVSLLGVALALAGVARLDARQRWQRAGQLTAVLFGAYVVLWSLYGFRFGEGAHGETGQPAAMTATADAPQARTLPLFNRSMDDKIGDLHSETHRAALSLALSLHVLPRAYVWGVADIVRAAVEGRQETLYVYGKHYEGDTPWFFFPAVLMAKLPLGLLLLSALGVALLARRRVPDAWRVPLWLFAAWGMVFLACLMRGNSGYAGIRHAAPVLPVLALFAAVGVAGAVSSASRLLRVGALALVLVSLLSALPVRRPWEYYNELVGRAPEAWRWFTDDGLDNGQRTVELADYYKEHVGVGERAYDFYNVADEERRARGLRFDSLRDTPPGSDSIHGTMFVNARWLAPRDSYDFAMFRAATPVARFGNLLVYRGTFRLPWLAASRTRAVIDDVLANPSPDLARAEQLLRQIVATYPVDLRSSFELGNMLLSRGERAGARQAYELARAHATPENPLVIVLARQIEALTAGVHGLAPIRNPWLE